MPTRVPSPRSSVRVVSRRRRLSSRSRRLLRDPRIFQCADHHDALYCDSVLEALHGLHEPVFSFAQSRRVVYMYLLTLL
jgi:hypothetical protein